MWCSVKDFFRYRYVETTSLVWFSLNINDWWRIQQAIVRLGKNENHPNPKLFKQKIIYSTIFNTRNYTKVTKLYTHTKNFLHYKYLIETTLTKSNKFAFESAVHVHVRYRENIIRWPKSQTKTLVFLDWKMVLPLICTIVQ